MTLKPISLRSFSLFIFTYYHRPLPTTISFPPPPLGANLPRLFLSRLIAYSPVFTLRHRTSLTHLPVCLCSYFLSLSPSPPFSLSPLDSWSSLPLKVLAAYLLFQFSSFLIHATRQGLRRRLCGWYGSPGRLAVWDVVVGGKRRRWGCVKGGCGGDTVFSFVFGGRREREWKRDGDKECYK